MILHFFIYLAFETLSKNTAESFFWFLSASCCFDQLALSAKPTKSWLVRVGEKILHGNIYRNKRSTFMDVPMVKVDLLEHVLGRYSRRTPENPEQTWRAHAGHRRHGRRRRSRDRNITAAFILSVSHSSQCCFFSAQQQRK